jgi:hypothetical protein
VKGEVDPSEPDSCYRHRPIENSSDSKKFFSTVSADFDVDILQCVLKCKQGIVEVAIGGSVVIKTDTGTIKKYKRSFEESD